MNVIILGAGGHAQVVADTLLCACKAGADCHPIGFLDDDPALTGSTFLGLPVLGAIDQLDNFGHDAIIVAIGDNRSRARLFETFRARGERFACAVHPTAVLAPDVRFGEGVVICAGVVVNTGAVIGNNVILNTGCTIDHHSEIGDHAHIAPGAHLGGNVRVGQGTLVGIGAVVVPGCTAGEWSIIGAGSVAAKDVPAYTTVVGVPARMVKRWNSQR